VDRQSLPVFVEFVASSAIVSWFSSWRKQAEAALKQARDGLQTRVEERTAELKLANEQLLAEMAAAMENGTARRGPSNGLRAQATSVAGLHDQSGVKAIRISAVSDRKGYPHIATPRGGPGRVRFAVSLPRVAGYTSTWIHERYRQDSCKMNK